VGTYFTRPSEYRNTLRFPGAVFTSASGGGLAAGLTRIGVVESPAKRSSTVRYQFPICWYLIERSSLKQDGIRAPKMLEI
jgi:hypothetical protein